MWDTMTYGDTINERAVRILLECILVQHNFRSNLIRAGRWLLHVEWDTIHIKS